MESLKKIISLNQASKISGYNQDYLGYLIRVGEMKGIKKGRVWFTTEEDVKDYILKKKIRNQEFAFREFFSPSRVRKIIMIAIIVFVCGSLLLLNLNKNKLTPVEEIHSAVQSDGGSLSIPIDK